MHFHCVPSDPDLVRKCSGMCAFDHTTSSSWKGFCGCEAEFASSSKGIKNDHDCWRRNRDRVQRWFLWQNSAEVCAIDILISPSSYLPNFLVFNRHGVSSSMVDREEVFRFDKLEKGGGKGGSLMQFTEDHRLLIKALSADDHVSLLAIGQSYCKWVSCSSSCLICRLQSHWRLWNNGTMEFSYIVDSSSSLLVRFFFHFYRFEFIR